MTGDSFETGIYPVSRGVTLGRKRRDWLVQRDRWDRYVGAVRGSDWLAPVGWWAYSVAVMLGPFSCSAGPIIPRPVY